MALHVSYDADTSFLHWFLPFALPIGLAASAHIASRNGWRGAWQKACADGSPTKAALCWLLVMALFNAPNAMIGIIAANRSDQINDATKHLSMVVASTAYLVFSSAFWFVTAWCAGYWVGRRSRNYRGSVVDAVGTAAWVGGAVAILITLCQFLPRGINDPNFVSNIPAYLYGFITFAAFGVVRFFGARLGVRAGEKARRLPYHTKQIA